MGTGLKICRKRTACAVLASGVVISLTALTGGVAPAFAKPGDEPVVPTTTVVAPAPVVEVPTQQEQPAQRPTAADVPTQAPVAPVAPVAPTAAPEPVAPAPVQAPTVEAPPKTRAPQPTPTAEVPTQVPTQTREPVPSATAPSRAPVTTTTQSPSTQTPQSQAPQSQAPQSQAPQSQTPPSQTPPSQAARSEAPSSSAAPSPGLVAPAPSPGETSAPASTPATASSAAPTTSPGESSSVSETTSPAESQSRTSATSSPASPAPAAERVIEKVEPQTLVAPDQDVLLAKSAKIVEEKPVAAPTKDVEEIANVIDVKSLDRDRFNQNGLRDDDRVRLAGDRDWDRNVRQWRPDWVEYDEYYRPVLSNPYRDPVRIVYIYQNAPRIVWIPPLARIVLEVAQAAAYSFTALVTNPINQVLNVAVGSFFGGGYNPGFGLPLPPPPPPLLNFANVPVQVRYPNANYEPFRVSKIVDVGDDAQYGERKVLLDGVTPAWGQWTQTPSGERSFEVHKTQQFPGLDDPRPGPLPGDYQLRLAADESSSGMNKRDVYLIAVAIACGALSLGAVVLSVLLGRRRRSL